MSEIVCNVHGYSAGALVSPLIDKVMEGLLDKKQLLEADNLGVIEMIYDGEPGIFLIDKEYLRSHNLLGVSTFVYDESNDDHNNFMFSVMPTCPGCLKDFLNEYLVKFPSEPLKKYVAIEQQFWPLDGDEDE